MTGGDAFLQAIIENPDDDTPRLVYADWLEEHGHPDRAAFLRVQCHLARLPEGNPRWPGLEAEERALLAKHAAGWLRGRLERFLEEFRPNDAWDRQVRRLAVEQEALPVLFDIGGFSSVRLDGQVVSVLWDEPESRWTEEDPRLRNMALCQGAKKYPELRLLIPPRPASSRECHHCMGTGVLRDLPRVICYCGGLGWLP
jgi:uncharacterized protein (TIGR02996 family)